MSHDDGKTTIHATINKERNDVKMYRDFSALALPVLFFASFLKLLCLHIGSAVNVGIGQCLNHKQRHKVKVAGGGIASSRALTYNGPRAFPICGLLRRNQYNVP